MSHLKGLPERKVLFVSNHQTYFADVITLVHIFCSNKWKFNDKISNPIYLLNPKVNTYFVAAEETMKNGLFQKYLLMQALCLLKEHGVLMGRK